MSNIITRGFGAGDGGSGLPTIYIRYGIRAMLDDKSYLSAHVKLRNRVYACLINDKDSVKSRLIDKNILKCKLDFKDRVESKVR
jgi:hypothetical protein